MKNRSAVAATDELMVRAKQEVKGIENDQTRVIAKFEMPEDALPDFADEKPTKPGKHVAEEPPSVIARHPLSDPPAPLEIATMPMASLPRGDVEVSGMVQKAAVLAPRDLGTMEFMPDAERLSRSVERPRWPRIALAVLAPAAIIVTVLAVMRYLGLAL